MIYVMSDIHGNEERFNSVMKQIKLQKEDTLYILGDVVDRYKYGIKILRRIMKMPNVKMLLGNHEFMMNDAIGDWMDGNPQNNRITLPKRLWYVNGGDVTHEYLKHICKEHRAEVINYVRNLPINIDIEVNGIKYKLVHASPIENFETSNFHYRDYSDANEFAVWERWDETQPIPEGFVMIFGHTPTFRFQNIRPYRVWKTENAIGIDCGSGYRDGRLCALRLDDMKEFYSQC